MFRGGKRVSASHVRVHFSPTHQPTLDHDSRLFVTPTLRMAEGTSAQVCLHIHQG